jgi:hypothetical protein
MPSGGSRTPMTIVSRVTLRAVFIQHVALRLELLDFTPQP